jgi:hypothetical protein
MGEEGVAAVMGVVEVAIAEEDDDDELVEVIPVPKSPPRKPMYKHTTRIRRSPSVTDRSKGGRLGLSLETGFAVWPLPPPPPSSGALSTTPPPQDPAAATESPPLRSPIGG